ncbi:hypothetical protein [Urechidicola vernalis]|uniref:Lipoprotein n=1 Tax=Urechidicola vernalis TaxID=3075600 RepID=A0ABU2Y1C1_9FLAO|nr:hypothetical protein [Urechidicola sp. P050]MDT0551802.1 hypothetical protein [Urechidicola sp. P050]
MKKYITLLLCLVFVACDDGDIAIPAFEFEDEVHNCEVRNGNYTLFRLGIAEGLIVTIAETYFKEEETSTELGITSENVIYRTFSSEVSPAYFCSDIPPTEPTILSNWTGVSGVSNLILIDTVEELDDMGILIGYTHHISFQNLKVEKGENYLAFEEGTFGEFFIPLN